MNIVKRKCFLEEQHILIDIYCILRFRMNLKFFIDNLFLGFLQSLKGLLSIWTIDALLEKKLTERYERVLEAKEKGFRVPNHRLKPKKPPKVSIIYLSHLL